MPKLKKSSIVGLPVLFALTTISYVAFLRYQPKILKQIEEVKGLKQSQELLLPYPKGSQKIGLNKTSELDQITFQTQRTPKEVQEFYQNVFTAKDWELDSAGDENGFLTSKYKGKTKVVTVKASQQEKPLLTIASIEISDR